MSLQHLGESLRGLAHKEHVEPTPEEAYERLSHYHRAKHHFHKGVDMCARSGRVIIAGAGFLADAYDLFGKFGNRRIAVEAVVYLLLTLVSGGIACVRKKILVRFTFLIRAIAVFLGSLPGKRPVTVPY